MRAGFSTPLCESSAPFLSLAPKFHADTARMLVRQALKTGTPAREKSARRSTHRNGYHPRPWATRVGDIELAVPSKRSRESHFPSFPETRKRSEPEADLTSR